MSISARITSSFIIGAFAGAAATWLYSRYTTGA